MRTRHPLPVPPPRRSAHAIPQPAPAVVRAAAGDDASARAAAAALAVPSRTRSLALWGSSSMESHGDDVGTPVRNRLSDLLTMAVSPLHVHQLARGSQTSHHTMIARGATMPLVTLPAGYSGGKVEVTLTTAGTGIEGFAVPGTIGSMHGVLGTARGTYIGADNKPHPYWYWTFEADRGIDGSGPFVSDYLQRTADSRHLVWAGKNNINQVETVCSHVDAITALARDASHYLVLGQFADARYPVGSTARGELDRVNNYQRNTYGDRFLDVQQLLTTEWGLTSHPVRELRQMDDPGVQADLSRGIVPAAVRVPGDIHLNGWGYAVLFWALIERMRAIRWL